MIAFRLFFAAVLACGLAACRPCDDVGVNLGAACQATTLAAGTPLTFDVREDCGTSCSDAPTCSVTVDGSTVSFVVSQSECRSDCTPSGTCEKRQTTCDIPKLEAGEYTFVIPGQPTQTVQIAAGGSTSCKL